MIIRFCDVTVEKNQNTNNRIITKMTDVMLFCFSLSNMLAMYGGCSTSISTHAPSKESTVDMMSDILDFFWMEKKNKTEDNSNLWHYCTEQ